MSVQQNSFTHLRVLLVLTDPGLNLQYLNLNVFGSAPNQSCYQPSAGGLLELVLRPNLSIFVFGNCGIFLEVCGELAENSRNFAFYESALLRKLYTSLSNTWFIFLLSNTHRGCVGRLQVVCQISSQVSKRS
jgi:hypothetical protein